jgi:protein-tyrosine-phosphatase/DNA-binding transcriptional ArsR family regulator
MELAPAVHRMLASDLRWSLLTALAKSDLRVSELMSNTGGPSNLLAYHLRLLRGAGLVRERRSSADARDVYYSLDTIALDAALREAVVALHPWSASPDEGSAAGPSSARVLFLCTRNSARSQLAEAMLRAWCGASVHVRSAGSDPAGVHPLVFGVLEERGISDSSLRSKHFDEFAGEPFDYVITLCDRVREVCPELPGHPRVIHWSLPDPVEEQGAGDQSQLEAFRTTVQELETRLQTIWRGSVEVQT